MEIAVFTPHLEVLVAHPNARLNPHGRRLLVHRVRVEHRPVAHVAKELGISRQCAHRWVARYDEQGEAGLHDQSSRPHHSPTRTSPDTEQQVLAARQEHRCGPIRLAHHTGVPAATCGRILRRHRIPRLADCDPLTGALIRSTRHSPERYERETPGELVHLDVKKIGRIPDGGGWKAHGRSEQVRGRGIGHDYVHAAVDDHTRLAYAEILLDEKGPTAAGFLTRAATRTSVTADPSNRADSTPSAWPSTCGRVSVYVPMRSSRGMRPSNHRPRGPMTPSRIARCVSSLPPAPSTMPAG